MITDRAQPLLGMAQSPDEPRPTSLVSRPGRIDIRANAANHPHRSTHRGLFVIGGLCHPANGDHSPSR